MIPVLHRILRRFCLAGVLLLPAAYTACQHRTAAIAHRAAQGDRNAQYEYGKRLLTGKKAPCSPQRAICWFKVAAQQGHAGAEAALGVCYSLGIGAPKDIRKAREWYGKSISHGHRYALLELARMEVREKHPQAAIDLLTPAAREDHLMAQLLLAHLYMGNGGVRENPEKAVENIRYAAMQGSGEAAYLMFLCFAEGYGVPPTPSLAYGWLANAAELDYAPAKKLLSAFPKP